MIDTDFFGINEIIYVLVSPSCVSRILAGFKISEESLSDVLEIPYKGAYLLYGSNAAENNEPMNRFIELENGQIICISGSFIIVNKDENGYYSLDDEQVQKFMKEFANPHMFMIIYDKLMIFEKSSSTEYNMLHAFEVSNGVEENG